MNAKRVVVIGAGLAGMSAAVALESAGLVVTLLEARRTLGGRAGSFEDPQTGEQLDNCQHVLLGCCTNLIDFYRRIDALRLIRFDRTTHLRDGAGHHCELSGTRGLPAPLHLGPSFSRFSILTMGEKLELSRAMLAMLRLGRRGRLQLMDVPFGDWLDQHRQSPELVRKLYDPLLISALNEDTRRASAAYAIQVFQDSLLANSASYVVGVPNGPLGELYARLQLRDVRLGARVAELEFDGSRVTGVRLQSGDVLPCDTLIIATARQAVLRWIPQQFRQTEARFANLDRLEDVPILGAHLWFDRPVLSEPHVAFIDGPLQWVFRKDATGRAVHGVISAARQWLDVPKDAMAKQFEEQVRSMLPLARDAKLERCQTVIEKRATFSPSPGVDRFRPSQSPRGDGAIANLYLAGDYTQTGWPATMEGAVRSGYLAAQAISRRRFLLDDLPVQWPGALLGLDD